MSVIPGQEVAGRRPAFNAAIILTIVWIDNHAHYREMEGGRGRKWRSSQATRLKVCSAEVWRTDTQHRRDVLPLGCLGKLVCSKSLHLIWDSQSNYLGWCFQGEERLTRARGQDRTTLRPTGEELDVLWNKAERKGKIQMDFYSNYWLIYRFSLNIQQEIRS